MKNYVLNTFFPEPGEWIGEYTIADITVLLRVKPIEQLIETKVNANGFNYMGPLQRVNDGSWKYSVAMHFRLSHNRDKINNMLDTLYSHYLHDVMTRSSI